MGRALAYFFRRLLTLLASIINVKDYPSSFHLYLPQNAEVVSDSGGIMEEFRIELELGRNLCHEEIKGGLAGQSHLNLLESVVAIIFDDLEASDFKLLKRPCIAYILVREDSRCLSTSSTTRVTSLLTSSCVATSSFSQSYNASVFWRASQARSKLSALSRFSTSTSSAKSLSGHPAHEAHAQDDRDLPGACRFQRLLANQPLQAPNRFIPHLHLSAPLALAPPPGNQLNLLGSSALLGLFLSCPLGLQSFMDLGVEA